MDSNMDKVIAQIKKVLRLARGTSEAGERAAAEATAKRLAERHGIRLDTLDETDDVKNVMTRDATPHAFHVEDGMACGLIRNHFAVVCMVEQLGRTVHYVWFGNALNIDVARHVQHIVTREARKAYREYRKTHPHAVRAAYMQGWFAAIDRTLTLNPLRNDIDQVRSESRQAEATFLAWRKEAEKGGQTVNTVDTSKNQRRPNADEVVAGLRAGMAVNLSRPVGGTTERRDMLARPAERIGYNA